MSTVYLALGSNLGDRLQYIERAIDGLKEGGLKVLKLSRLIETDPVGGVPQGKYLNAVLKATTTHCPEELHVLTREIERKLGRVKKTINGPRVIDIDILLYDDIKLITAQLLIPHPRMFERPFVMGPLGDRSGIMRIVKTIGHLRQVLDEVRRKGQKIGFVPTMGYFHEGHLSLMRRAKKECNICVVSIYVNPKQFGPQEDLKSYPRDIKRDAVMIAKENVDILFIPSDNVVYPNRYLTYIDVETISHALCGKYRPGHFKGVATVVAKLLNIVQPDAMSLGQKDAQQVVVLRQMATDLDFPVSIRVVPTAREKDGLAMSSRNIYLSPEERAQAPVLHRALEEAALRIKDGERSAAKIIGIIQKIIRQYTAGKIQYVACVDSNTLEPLKRLKGKVLIASALFLGKTRLIDNVIISIKKSR